MKKARRRRVKRSGDPDRPESIPSELPPSDDEGRDVPKERPSQYSVKKWAGPGMPNPAMQRHILASEGYSVFQWADAPGGAYGMHKHDNDQSHWIISGSLELTVERYGTFVLEAGDRDLMPRGTYHSARVLGTEPVIYLIGELPS